MTSLHLDAEALYADLRRGVQALLRPDAALVGIWSGGAWLAERLGADHTKLPFEVDGKPIVLIDDVLYTGRTIRAVINELYDFGRPASVTLAVLVDRGGRELPIQAAYSAARITLPREQRLSLARDEAGRFSFDIKDGA